MSYRTIDDEAELQGQRIINPGEEERRRVLGSGKVCGNCKHFSAREGQRLMEATRFIEQLVKEHHWAVHHLGAPPEDLGDCGMARSGERGSDTMLTSKMAVACESYRPR